MIENIAPRSGLFAAVIVPRCRSMMERQTASPIPSPSGLVVTKLDGTAKGGAVISMRAEVDIPVKWIGLGEKVDDIEPFDADVFLDEIFRSNEEPPKA